MTRTTEPMFEAARRDTAPPEPPALPVPQADRAAAVGDELSAGTLGAFNSAI